MVEGGLGKITNYCGLPIWKPLNPIHTTVGCELEEEPLLLPDARGDVKVPPRGLRRVELEVVRSHHRVEGARVFLEGTEFGDVETYS